MKITNIKTEDLTPFEKNPKTHPPEQIKKIVKSFEEYGFTNPILYIKHEGQNLIIAGHGRLEAAKIKGLRTIPAILLDLPYEKALPYMVADNKLVESPWDDIMLMNIFTELESLELDLELTGFDEDEISAILDSNLDIDGPEPPTPHLPEVPVSELGDIYQLGKHRLMCGDSTKRKDVKKLMGKDVKADMIFTDPPYNVNYIPEERPIGGRASSANKLGGMLGDKDFDIISFIETLPNLCKGAVYLCNGCRDVPKVELKIREVFKRESTWIIWSKNNHSIGRRDYHRKHEFILYNWFKDKVWNGGRTQVDVWEVDRDNAVDYIHPTQKPIKLSAKAIKNSSNRGGVVLDLFGGSGSTLIACEQLDRICYMMELVPRYIDVIIKRWEDYTGKKAKKLKT